MRDKLVKIFLHKHLEDNDLRFLYERGMQTHVIVSPEGGRREGTSWSNGIETWYPFVINSDASANKPIHFNFEERVQGIGLTGWDWKEKVSRWVAFDFDSIVNHKAGLTQAELNDILDNVSRIEWVNVRYSTSGRGIHVYVFLEPPVETENRSEHAAVARAILHRMSALTGYDFKDKVDICGGNMWVWHRKMKSPGLELIKEGIPLEKIPNWRDHVDVVNQKDVKKPFDDVARARSSVALDTQHKQLISWLQDNKCIWWWDNDRHLMVCHTCDLKIAHNELNMRGIFETESSHSTDYNCFCFPIRKGGWVIRRFSKGVNEHISWDRDESGWTRCFYNVEMDLKTASKCFGGLEHPSGGFMFQHAEMAIKAAEALGVFIEMPEYATILKCKLKEHRDGRLIAEIEDKEHHLTGKMADWIHEKGVWKRLFNKPRNTEVNEDLFKFDDVVRHLVSPTNEDHGWMIRVNDQWNYENLTHAKLALEAMDLSTKEVKNILGTNIMTCWKMVNIPFAPEYPGNRRWNLNSAQLRYSPSTEVPSNLKLECPFWWNILNHIGCSLDEILGNNEWAKSNQILTGVDYLTCWIASLFQEPTEQLPYLFLYGEQNTGKSILHEALSLLMTNGCVRADNALTNKSGFNAEIERAVLCVIEEVNIGESNTAYNRIKDWVTSRELQIHRKGKTPYTINNVTHWIQTANNHTYCPIFPGDTRIVVLNVPKLKKVIPKKKLIDDLMDEAPKFISYILNFQIPTSPERLNLPVITTMHKENIQRSNVTPVMDFLENNCFKADGYFIEFSEFFDKFIEWLGPTDEYYSKQRVSREIPPEYVKGRYFKNNHLVIANLSFDYDLEPRKPYYLNEGKVYDYGR